MIKPPLYGLHEALGARFGDYSGWSMPESYGSLEDECRTAREAAVVADLTHRGKLRMSGRDRVKFLQGMITNDVEKLTAGEGVYAAMLTVKGKMITDMTIYCERESFLIDLEPGMNGAIRDALLKFRLSYKSEIEDATEELALLSVHGPGAASVVRGALGGGGEEAASVDRYRFVEVDVGEGGAGKGARAIVAGVNRTGGRGYDLYVPKGNAGVVWDRLIKSGARPIGLRAMETLRIEAGIPRYGVDMNEETIPLEAGLDHAVNYDKGCYVGQEVVARIHWRGHVNWVLSGFLLAGRELPSPGSELRDGNKKVGYITSSAYSPSLDRVIALGYIRRELSEPGSEAVLNTEDGGMAELVKTPFVQA